MKYLITKKSGNRKVGPIMVTTSSRDTCPNACPFRSNGCYADGGPLRGLWDNLTATEQGDTFKSGRANIEVKSHADLLEAIEAQPPGSLWRHNQAGDLPGDGDTLDHDALDDIVVANRGRNGFTYTHKPLASQQDRDAIELANAQGFTVNLSANNLEHADALKSLNIGPVVTVLPADQMDNLQTPDGHVVVVCPVVTGKTESCATCRLCAHSDRRVIVGFPSHGVAKRKAERAMSDFIVN